MTNLDLSALNINLDTIKAPESLPWTSEQLAFFTAVTDTTDNLCLDAKAGTGKTTTLQEAANRLGRGQSILAVAFNKKTKDEMEDKLPDHVTCKTLNGLGYGALANYLNIRRVPTDGNKVGKIVGKIIDEIDQEAKELWAPCKNLVAKAKLHGLVPQACPGLYKSLIPDTYEEWERLANYYDIDFSSEIFDIAYYALIENNRQIIAKESCDFDDQIYFPICWGLSFRRYDVVLIDEAQDLSLINHRQLHKSLKPGGRLIAVGDPYQAIYGFRGALPDSLPQLIKDFELTVLPLSICWRCPREVIREAQDIVPGIQAAPDASDGIVSHLDQFSADTFHHGDAILCRNTAPLIQMAYRLINEGSGVHVIGRDIGTGIKSLIKTLNKKGGPVTDLDELLLRVDLWKQNETAKAIAKREESRVDLIGDKADSITAVINGSITTTVRELFSEIDLLFGRESAPITLSTIHRFKGLERNRIFFLNSYLLPSKWVKLAAENNPETGAWMIQQEHNLRYVAVTRAMEELVYINSDGWEVEEEPGPGEILAAVAELKREEMEDEK